MNDIKTKMQIKLDEGYRSKVYLDSKGFLTGGWGHHDENLEYGKEYSSYFWEMKFDEDYAEAVRGYQSLGIDLDEVRRSVMIMMVFNLGLPKLLGFKKMLGELRTKDYIMAAYEGMDSKWRRQVKNRAHRMMAAMATGVWV